MPQLNSFCSAILAGLLCFSLLSCTMSPHGDSSPPLTFPETSQVTILFDETRVPDQCRVFSHLLVSVPSGIKERELKNRVEQFGMKNGADYILVGMARESSEDVEDISFHSYGPRSPYSFKTNWQGWTFGFYDWNSRGPLVDYGYNRISSDKPAFDTEATVQMVLLNCQIGPNNQ